MLHRSAPFVCVGVIIFLGLTGCDAASIHEVRFRASGGLNVPPAWVLPVDLSQVPQGSVKLISESEYQNGFAGTTLVSTYQVSGALSKIVIAPMRPISAATQPVVANLPATPGEQAPSEDPLIPDFHSLGLINGKTNIFRCACPVRDIAKLPDAGPGNAESLAAATARMKHLYDLGIRTVFSFEDGNDEEGINSGKPQRPSIALEKAAAAAVGITYINRPMANKGPNSMETMSDADVLKWVDPVAAEILKYADTAPVAIHCSAGHDRTGVVTAYIRMKVQHWSVDAAIAEMRRDGHNWPKYSNNNGVSSWHEDHLRAIAAVLPHE